VTRPAKGALAHLAHEGAELAVRVTPNARAEAVCAGDPISVSVTAPPADGKANAAVQAALARALGLPRSRVTLVRGARSRDKVLRIG